MITQDEIFEKLKAAIPGHYFCEDGLNEAVFQGIAAVLHKVYTEAENHFNETFICNAVGGYLDEHGFERNLVREDGETTSNFQQRVKNLINTTSCDEIKRVVDALLDVGESTIIEDFNSNAFYSRDFYFNRSTILIEEIKDAFSIVVDNQVHEPYSFYSREYFFTREDFVGRLISSFELFELIVKTVNRNKACGTSYRLIERAV